jgi:dCMP deaminase
MIISKIGDTIDLTSTYSQEDLDISMLGIALTTARDTSGDPRTQNASLLLATNGEYVTYANQFPSGVLYSPERIMAPTKYFFFVHGECGAIYRAAKNGLCTHGATLYAVAYSCADCAKAIVQSGVKRCVGIRKFSTGISSQWKDSCDAGLIILKEGGVKCDYIDYYYGIEVLRDGKLVKV